MDATTVRNTLERLLALYDDTNSIKVAARDQRVAIFAHGWYSLLRRTGRAVIKLTDGGYDNEAAPLRRSLIEHTVALNWLTKAGDDAVNSLLRTYQLRTKRVGDAVDLARLGVEESFNYILNVEIDASAEDRYLAFKHCCEEYGTPDLYTAYLLETARSHPSFTTVDSFVDIDENSGATTLLANPKNEPLESTLLVAGLISAASRIFNSLLVGTPWTSALDEIEQSLQQIQRD